jgi:uncharacterized protein (TIGR03067 family)
MTRLLAVVALTLALSANAADDAVKDELARFNGTWKGVSVVHDGKDVPKPEAEAIRLTVTGEKYILKAGGEDIEGTHKLDPATTPKQIDAVRSKGPHVGEKMLGIYELKGDTFRVCFAAPGKTERPTELKSTAGSGYRLLVLQREKR